MAPRILPLITGLEANTLSKEPCFSRGKISPNNLIVPGRGENNFYYTPPKVIAEIHVLRFQMVWGTEVKSMQRWAANSLLSGMLADLSHPCGRIPEPVLAYVKLAPDFDRCGSGMVRLGLGSCRQWKAGDWKALNDCSAILKLS